MNVNYRNVTNKVKFEVSSFMAEYFGRPTIFISTNQLIEWSKEWARTLPRCDVVIGVLRSGMIPAMVISSELGIPFSTANLYRQGDVFRSNQDVFNNVIQMIWNGVSDDDLERYIQFNSTLEGKVGNTVLVVDDTINTGGNMQKIVATMPSDLHINFGAVISSKEYVNSEWLNHIQLPRDRYGEWNMAVADIGSVVSDMDGVFCENPPVEGYEAWIKDPRPLFLSQHPIAVIVTARNERYRDVTEAWLKKYHIQFGKLEMGVGVDERIDLINHLDRPPEIILESDSIHAEKIWKGTGIPCLCFDTMRMYSRAIPREV